MKTALVLTIVILSLVIGCQHRQLECTCKYQEGERVTYTDVMNNVHEYVIEAPLYNPKYRGCQYLMTDEKACNVFYIEEALTPIQ